MQDQSQTGTWGFPDWETWQAALDQHLATIPPEQHDMVRREWAKWQAKHMRRKHAIGTLLVRYALADWKRFIQLTGLTCPEPTK